MAANTKNAKTLYMGEFVQMGPTRVTVMSDILQSKYKGRPNYVVLLINGEERWYNVENDACQEFWRGQKGRTFTVLAEGKRDQATLSYMGEQMPAQGQVQPPPQTQRPTNYPPPTQATAPAQQPQQAPPPTQHQQPAGQRPPPPATVAPDKAVLHMKAFVAKNQSLIKIALRAAWQVKEGFEMLYKEQMDPSTFNYVFTSMLYGADRSGLVAQLPVNLDFVTLMPVLKQPTQAAPAQPPPQQVQQPPPQQQYEPAEPVDPNTPF